MALNELARYLPRSNHHNRYLRSGMRPHPRDEAVPEPRLATDAPEGGGR